MNTGIGDAVNLAWKLAAVLQGRAAAGAARQLRARADRLRPAAGGDHRPRLHGRHQPRAASPGCVRAAGRAAPAAARWSRSTAVRRFMFRTISQTAIHYRASRLSEGRGGAASAAATGCRGSRLTVRTGGRQLRARSPRSTGRCTSTASRAGARGSCAARGLARARLRLEPGGAAGGPRARRRLPRPARRLRRLGRSGGQRGQAGALPRQPGHAAAGPERRPGARPPHRRTGRARSGAAVTLSATRRLSRAHPRPLRRLTSSCRWSSRHPPSGRRR